MSIIIIKQNEHIFKSDNTVRVNIYANASMCILQYLTVKKHHILEQRTMKKSTIQTCRHLLTLSEEKNEFYWLEHNTVYSTQPIALHRIDRMIQCHFYLNTSTFFLLFKLSHIIDGTPKLLHHTRTQTHNMIKIYRFNYQRPKMISLKIEILTFSNELIVSSNFRFSSFVFLFASCFFSSLHLYIYQNVYTHFLPVE